MPQPDANARIVPGSRLGRYTVLERLGAGAMGEVYLARDESLGRHVAIKALTPEHLHRADLRERFAREARAVARISHPNVVQIFDISEHDGRPYFVMEYLRGVDVGQLLDQRGPLPSPQAIRIGLSAALGLAEAAAAGVIHRDVKPANLFLTERGTVKVTDFGLAKGSELGKDVTGLGITLGTPDYMSPEQAQGLPLDVRTDIYALGCTLFHLVAGRPPYRLSGETVSFADVVVRHLRGPVPRLDQQGVIADGDLAVIIERMMAKDPSQRPAYPEIIEALSGSASRMNASMPSITSVSAAPAEREAKAESSSGRLALPLKTPRWAAVLTLCSGMLFAVCLGLYLFLRPRLPPPSRGPTDAAPRVTVKTEIRRTVLEGMVLLPALEPGSPALAVAVLPVTVSEVRQHTPALMKTVRPMGEIAAGLSLESARSVTKSLGGRLPTSEEWLRIEASRRALVWPESCEWVDDGPTPKAGCFKARRAVVRNVKLPYKNSIFRVVKLFVP